jgi:hypothetical protein
MDAETVESVVASNFKRSFRVQTERAAEVEKLPPQIRDMLGNVSTKMIGD